MSRGGGHNAHDLDTTRRLIHALDRAAAKLEALERAASEPIAVVGVGCRFPGGADSPDAFWRRLAEGFDGIGEVPSERWDVDRFYDPDPDAAGKIYTRHGGFLEQIDGLDARFFEIAPREAASMDPQQRLLLEVCWEALEHAALPPQSLCRSQTGVYVGVTLSEYGNLLAQSVGREKIDAWFGTGNSLNAMAGRVAHTLGLQGPAMAIDTACSSSLVAVHLACQGLRSGECEIALAGGVNLILSPEVMIGICRAKMLAADGRCKTFDAAADGYVRGEGCGVVVLKRLSDALQQRDNILALLRGSAVNQDGPSSGFTVPNGQAQQALIRQALATAKVAPSEIDYLEAHGTGTSLGDPIEVQAAAAVLRENRSSNRPLILGSVKTNVGHLESAAGIAGLIKVVLALKHSEIPKHLHYQNPNPHIPWQQLPVVVATRAMTWPQTDHPRRAAISSFGASGTNAHVIVEQAPETVRPSNKRRDERALHLLALSAKTPQALRDLAERYAHLLADSPLPLADICFSANTGRSHFTHRLAVVAATAEQASTDLQRFVSGDSSSSVLDGTLESKPRSCGPVRQDKESWDQWLRRLGQLYVRGAEIDWHILDIDHSRRRVSLPTYPWQRKSHWFQPTERPREAVATVPIEETATLRALRQGDVARLMERLTKDSRFSDEEKSLLPKLLQIVAGHHCDEQTAVLTDQWFYQVQWRRQLLGGRQSPPEFLPAPNEICQQLRAEVEHRTSSEEFQHYWQAVAAIEQLSVEYLVAALLRMGLDRQALQQCSRSELSERLQVDHRHQRLLNRLLEMLAESEAPRDGEAKRSEAILTPRGDPDGLYRAMLAKYPSAHAELRLLKRCGSQLDQVLRGRQDPLQLLFPEDSDVTAAQLYESSPGARVMNALIARAMTAVLDSLPASRMIRILEIGAGTGGTTSSILSRLPAERCEYVFTDISPRFTTAARAKFQAYPFIDYRVLDIERSPEAQGFESARFDVVVAANVLHATRDLGDSVRHVHRLLAPGGMLMLLEATQPMRFVDMIFGLTEGWWRFTDHALRPSHPLLAARDWERLLRDCGFSEAVALTAAEDEDGVLSKQAVVIAQAAAQRPSHEDRRPKQHWTILADRAGVGRCLASLVRAQGDSSTEVYAAQRFTQTKQNVFTIMPERAHELHRVVAATAPSGGLHRVVHLWSLDAHANDLDTAATLGCRSVLNLAQCLTDTQWTQPAQLCLVTRQAAAVVDDDKVEGLAQAPLWGMARVMTTEHPELKPRRVDLGPHDLLVSAQLLFDELQSDDAEDEVAFRTGARFVSRLARADKALFSRDQAPANIRSYIASNHDSPRSDASYLITGGLGGLGLLVARSMVQQGARHLVLVGRREPSVTAASQLRDIEQMGARVVVCQADISLREDVKRVLAQIAGSSPPLRGVIHAAGVLDDGVLRRLSWERFARVMAPKVDGAWHLHQLTNDIPLDFFLLFSSATSLLGSSGQANHAAANAFLDALAYYRRARGLPALSINWGAWSQVGAAAGHEVSQRVKLKGIGTIPPQQGLALFKRLSGLPLAQVVVADVDWSQQSDLSPRFGELVTARAPKADQAQDTCGLTERVLSAQPHRRRALLINHVRQSVADALGLSATEISPDDGFMELGMDSLTSIELRNRLQNQLQTTLPSTMALDYPTAQRLADFLLEQLVGDNARPSEDLVSATDFGVPQNLSEDELGALIDEELKAVIK